MTRYSPASLASILVATVLASSPVLAQELEEIIVTATKREESLQTVPIAVTAFSQAHMDRVGATNIERLDALTPGLEWGQLGHSAKVSIRGMSVANSEANADSAVGLFVDGVYLGRGQQHWAVMSDLERVEILRGPQGTLFGRNTSGGSVNVVTRKPSQEKEFKFELTTGDYDHIGTAGYLNGPLSDTVSGRLTFFTENHDGYLENDFDSDEHWMDEDMWYVRGAIRHETDKLLVDVAVDHWDQGGNGNGFSGHKFFDQLVPDLNTWADLMSAFADPTFTFPDPPTAANTSEDWKIELNRSYRDTESTNGTVTITYDLPKSSIKSITGFSDYFQEAGGDTDFSDQFLADCRLVTDATIFSQELQLSSRNDGDLQWTVGLYYLDEEIDEHFRFEAPQGLQGLLGFLFGIPGDFTGTQDLSNRFGTATAESTAVFGEATYSLSDQLRLTFGARHTSDDKSYTSRDETRADTRGDVDTSKTFSKTTWKVGLDYQIDDSRMVYGSISTGFKSGGFNRFLPGAPPSLQYSLDFQPEELTNFAFGFKGDMLDNRLRTNVEVFYNEIDDFQSYAFDDSVPTSITTNAASAKTKGAELELTYVPNDQLQILFVAAYLDAYYEDYATFNNGAIDIDASGNKRELSPEWKSTLAVSYDIDLGARGTLTPYVQFAYKDDYFITAANESLFGLDMQESYTQTDVRLVWHSQQSQWRGELFLTNIEDNFPKTGAYLATGGYWITYGPEPRLFGAKLAYTF